MGVAGTATPMRRSAATEGCLARVDPSEGTPRGDLAEGTVLGGRSEPVGEGCRRPAALLGNGLDEQVGDRVRSRDDDGDEAVEQAVDHVLGDRLLDQLLLGAELGDLQVDVRDVELDRHEVALQTCRLDLVVRAVLLIAELEEALGQVDLAHRAPEALDVELLLCDLEVDDGAVVPGHVGVADHSNSFLLQSGGAGCSVLSTILTG